MMNTRLIAWLVAALGICGTAEAQTVALVTQNTANRTNSVVMNPDGNTGSQLADDFTVAAGKSWTITTIVLDADYSGTSPRTMNFSIVSDATNTPGSTVLCSVTGLAQAFNSTQIDDGRRRTFTPSWNCTLSGGASGTKYWLTAQGSSGSDSWHTSTQSAGSPAKGRPYGSSWPATTNQGNAPCLSSAFANVQRCLKSSSNNSAVDFKFALSGTTCNLATFYADTDSDTYGDANATTSACTAPTGYVASAGDCNDSNSAIHPGVTEACNGVDDNCDSTTDEGVTTTFYADADSDNYGDTNSTAQACSLPVGYAAVGGDCDSNNSAINPDANESCNELDDNCNSATDEGVTTTFYADGDDDNYGDSNGTIQACSEPALYAAVGGDCDNNNSAINPGAIELCNLVDDNCNSATDEGVTTTFYADGDDDNYGDANNTTQACSEPPLYASAFGDCDNSNADVYPGATEICNDIDDNCDTDVDEGVKTTFYADGDSDTYGDSNSTTEACTVPTGYVGRGGDCDPVQAAVNPGATEVCNEIDDNCDTDVDEGVKTTFYADGDADGYGDSNDSTQACELPTGYAVLDGDCDTNSSVINPGATDLNCDDVDDDCSGVPDDDDTDGDQTPNCDETCPDDEEKTEPGVCGCGLAESETEDPACGGGDADGDGLFNDDECADPEDCQDTDGDGTPDFEDTDSDGDGDLDAEECDEGACGDKDDDGLTDQRERGDADSDGDGTKDDLDDDSDNDGIDDGEECVEGVCLDDDEDGIRDHLDDSTGDGDLDDDSVPDSVECADQPCVDFDDDGIPDYGDTDSDNDTVLDTTDADAARTNPCLPNPNALACLSGDFDGDGVPNNTDVAPSDACQPNPDVVVCATGDTDDDGVLNGTDPAPTNACDPNPNALACPGGDTDGDTVPNKDDSAPNDACLPNANAVKCASGDADGDGTNNGTDGAPNDACIPSTKALTCSTGDADEDGTANGADAEPENPCKPNVDALACAEGDADHDGTNNGTDPEPSDACKPYKNVLACESGDTDLDGVKNADDPQPGNPCAPDSDAIACPTGDSDGDGVTNGKDPAPVDECVPKACDGPQPGDDDAGPGEVDSDGDGVSDDDECGKASKCPDTDGDGKPDNEDDDDDGDGIPTKVEDETADALGLDDDIDGDGLINSLDPDADGDGIQDGDEIADRDGDGTPDVFDPDQVKVSGGTSSCSVSTTGSSTDLASWPLLSLVGLLVWRRRRRAA